MRYLPGVNSTAPRPSANCAAERVRGLAVFTPGVKVTSQEDTIAPPAPTANMVRPSPISVIFCGAMGNAFGQRRKPGPFARRRRRAVFFAALRARLRFFGAAFLAFLRFFGAAFLAFLRFLPAFFLPAFLRFFLPPRASFHALAMSPPACLIAHPGRPFRAMLNPSFSWPCRPS